MRIGVEAGGRKIGKRENVSRETFSLCTCVQVTDGWNV